MGRQTILHRERLCIIAGVIIPGTALAAAVFAPPLVAGAAAVEAGAVAATVPTAGVPATPFELDSGTTTNVPFGPCAHTRLEDREELGDRPFTSGVDDRSVPTWPQLAAVVSVPPLVGVGAFVWAVGLPPAGAFAPAAAGAAAPPPACVCDSQQTEAQKRGVVARAKR
jgi:hypothetical protein